MTLMTEKRSLLTLVTEAIVEPALLRDFERLGVKGYTIWDARGRGSRGIRDAAWEEAANIRVEIICSRVLAEAVLEHLQLNYYANYAMVAFIHEVDILRPEKF